MSDLHKEFLLGIGLILFGIACIEATPYLPQNGVSALLGIISSLLGIIIIILSAFDKRSK